MPDPFIDHGHRKKLLEHLRTSVACPMQVVAVSGRPLMRDRRELKFVLYLHLVQVQPAASPLDEGRRKGRGVSEPRAVFYVYSPFEFTTQLRRRRRRTARP